MRDPARIDEVLGAVRELWQRFPDWRLGQLIVNVAPDGVDDPFYVEDEDLLKEVRLWCDLHGKPKP